MEGEDRQQQGQQQRLMCPRCESLETKFCYFNNYKISQPRYFCKTCRRYWTHGGTFRNIPVRGGVKKGRRPRGPSSSTSSGGGGEILRAVISSPPPSPLAMGSGVGGVSNLHLSGGRFRLPTQNLVRPQQNPPQLTFTRGNYLLGGYNIGLNPYIANTVCQGRGRGHPVGQLYQLPNSVQASAAHPIRATSLWTPPVISTATTSYTPFAANAAMFWDNSGNTICGTSDSSSIHRSGHLHGFGPFA